jgi:hypothetical protein
LDSAIYGNALDATVGGTQVLDVRSAVAAPPRARSLNAFKVNNPGKLQMAANGRVIYGNSTLPPSYSANSTTPTNVYESKSVQSGKFLKLKTADLPQADPATDATLPAGTYIWRNDGTIDYYAQEYVSGVIPPHASADSTLTSTGDLTTLIAGAGQTGPGPAPPIIMDPTTFTLEYSKNVYVKPQGGVTGLSIIPEPAIASGASPDRPKNLFRGLSGTNPVLAGTSALNLDGALIGKGSVTAGTNVTFQGPSVFETDPGKAVAIYAKRDVIMNALPPAVAANLDPASNSASHHALHHHGHHHMSSHGHWGHGHGHHHTNTFTSASIPNALGNLDGNDVLLAGLVYAGGNFTTNLGPGTMYLRGALVAYGGNADLDETPGTLGGIINLTSKGASVTFDPNYIANSMQLSGPSRLVLAMQNSY